MQRAAAAWALKLGYGVTKVTTLYAGVDVARMNGADDEIDGETDYTYVIFDIGSRFNFRTIKHSFVPYLNVGLSRQKATFDVDGDDLDITGLGLTAGGGFTYFFSPEVGLDLGLGWTFGNFSDAEYRGQDADIDQLSTTAGRLTLGITWYPSR